MYESRPGIELYYFYDSYGNLTSIRYIKAGETTAYSYYVTTNAQGDVLGIYTAPGVQVAAYEYDAWGNCTVYDVTQDSNGNNVFTEVTYSDSQKFNMEFLNPFRYRGYYYDQDMELYYVSSRYYDPEISRFISPDTTDILTATPMGLTDKNLYAYCDNNPVMRADSGGDFWHIVAGGVIGGVASFAATLLTGGSIEEAGVSFLFGAASGALTAAFPGVGLLIEVGASVAEEMTMNAIKKKTLHESTINVAVSAGVDTISSLTNSGSRLTKETMQEFVDAVPKTLKGNHPSVKRAAQKVVRRTSKTLVRETGEATVQKTIGNFFKNIFKAIF